MPDRSGLELLRKVRETRPDLPVIVMTAYSNLCNAVSAYEGGAFEYLPKPFDLDHAVSLVRRAASARRSRRVACSVRRDNHRAGLRGFRFWERGRNVSQVARSVRAHVLTVFAARTEPRTPALYLRQTHPELFRACTAILLYPQYWAWRLSNVMTSEITSLGCHSDLWRPREADFSALAKSLGWHKLLPPRRAAGDVLGTITTTVARITGLDPTCRVLCGIHDSNASYLCYRASRPADERFAVVSSGTWTVIMAHG
jgi:hypothetical protein